jgi:hypothetical protein
MTNIQQFVLDNSRLPQLKPAMRQVSLDVQEVGPAKSSDEGVEQAWSCTDQIGEVFSFSICQTNDKNTLALRPGTVLLMAGPPARTRTRKEVSEAFKRFERALNSLGAERK